MGSFWRSDDRSGFPQRAENTKQEWNGLIVDQSLWEIRQPQDFVRGVPDDQSVPDARSKLPEVWQGPIYTQLTAPITPGATFLPLLSTFGFAEDGAIGVMLDTGIFFNTTVSGAPTSTGVNVANAIQGYAAQNNDVVAYEAPGP